MMIFAPLIVTVPPDVLPGVHAPLTVAAWIRPVSSKPCSTAGPAPVNTGSPRVGITHGDTAPFGGFAVPPLASAMPTPVRARTLTAAIVTINGFRGIPLRR